LLGRAGEKTSNVPDFQDIIEGDITIEIVN
jgi:hypothetical protein